MWHVPRFSGLRHGFRPQSDCFRTDDPPALHVVLELPGVDPDSVQVVATGRTLLVTGVRERPQVAGARYQQMEIVYGSFQRSYELSDDVDASGATASYERGMLKVVLPLAAKTTQHARVPIEVDRR